jgi:ParB family chromosome partitioning protein
MQKQANPTQRGLGKGLASLLPTGEVAQSNPAPILEVNQEEKGARIPGISMIDVNLIDANVFQPRRDFDDVALKELSESIRAKGIIQPLVVRRAADGRTQLIAGERRLRAAKIAGLKHVPVVVRQSSDKESLELALIENIQRENLNCVEIALSYFQLLEDFQLKQEEISQRVGKDRSSVANHLRLLKLPEEIIRDLRESKLSFGHGKALLALKDSVQRMKVREEILAKNLSVRDTEELVTNLLTASEEDPGSVADKPAQEGDEAESMRHLAQKIGRIYGAKVALRGKAHKGTIVIKYFSREDLDRLVEQLIN